jgi:hypothetical protein
MVSSYGTGLDEHGIFLIAFMLLLFSIWKSVQYNNLTFYIMHYVHVCYRLGLNTSKVYYYRL